MIFRSLGSRHVLAAACLCGWFLGSAAAGEDREAERAGDTSAIRKRTAEFVEALKRGDPEGVAAFWTAGGEYAGGDGVTIRGRDRIQEAYSRLFSETKGLKVKAEIDSVRFLSRDTAVVEGTFEAQRANEAEPRSSGFSMLCVREGGQWSLAVLREWVRTTSLRDLEWLIGTWFSQTKDAEVRTTYRWNEGKTFLLMNFSVRGDGQHSTGLQVIGLDPATGAIRSWIFDGEGGFGSGTWEREGRRWVISASGIHPDGTSTKATNTLTPVDRDTFHWESRDRTHEDEALPDIKPITVTRIKAGEEPRE